MAIETATGMCSVALFRDGQVIGLLESDEHNAHSRILHVLIDRLFKESGTGLSDLSAVAVSKGPGSYTGLRIGVSTAKGFCYAKDIPLIAVNTLQGMAAGMREVVMQRGMADNYLLVPMIDARRMEGYSAIYDPMLGTVRETEAEIITAESFTELRRNQPLILAGDGAGKCRELLQHQENIIFLEGFEASARTLLEPAMIAFNAQKFENVEYFEPFYLKDLIAGKPRVKGLN